MTQKQIVRDLLRRMNQTQIELGEFFISWSGVSTLAYKGFSKVLLDIKKEVEYNLPGLRKENPGSLWPKTTLGALRDDISLSFNDLLALREICDTYSPKIQSRLINIDNLSIVLFHCRSLERRISTDIIELASPRDTMPPTQEHLNDVISTMQQFSRSKVVEYWPNVLKTGNRESHYRTPFIEATLVFDLVKIPDEIIQFRNDVDSQLSGRYCWFNDESLHLTVRALA